MLTMTAVSATALSQLQGRQFTVRADGNVQQAVHGNEKITLCDHRDGSTFEATVVEVSRSVDGLAIVLQLVDTLGVTRKAWCSAVPTHRSLTIHVVIMQ